VLFLDTVVRREVAAELQAGVDELLEGQRGRACVVGACCIE
jgi:hypothetical protein